MSQLPTIRDCPECGPRKSEARDSVFQRLGPALVRQVRVRSP
jgi:hypothetical protein